MSTPAGILTDLARLILLIRDQPDRKEDQKTAFRQFAAGFPPGDHALKVSAGDLRWDGVEVPTGRGDIAMLHDHLRSQGVGEIRFPSGVMTSTLLSLLRIIAAPPGTYGSFDHLTARLDAAGCGVVPVLPLDPKDRAPAAGTVPRGPATDPRGGRVRPNEDDGHLNALGPDALTEAKVGMMHFVTLQTRSLNPLDELMPRLAGAESEEKAGELLNQIIAAGEMATRQGDWADLLRAAHSLVQLEAKGAKGGEHRGYGIALRRLLPRSALERLARLSSQAQHRVAAVAVLQRMGADGTEVLLNLLVNAEQVGERRSYFSALKEMTEGGELLVHMLSHDQWFVVRNVADLCGELRQESAVPALTQQLTHSDERVRRAVAGALGKIGGPAAAEPLRRALKDGVPAVRLQAAQDLDGRRNRNLAMSLSVGAEAEGRPEVQREMYLALGRIGSSDAIQALRKAAEPGGRFFRRKPTAVRLAAVAGLHTAGPSAANVLKDLLDDEEKDVREAVQRALTTLWE